MDKFKWLDEPVTKLDVNKLNFGRIIKSIPKHILLSSPLFNAKATKHMVNSLKHKQPKIYNKIKNYNVKR